MGDKDSDIYLSFECSSRQNLWDDSDDPEAFITEHSVRIIDNGIGNGEEVTAGKAIFQFVDLAGAYERGGHSFHDVLDSTGSLAQFLELLDMDIDELRIDVVKRVFKGSKARKTWSKKIFNLFVVERIELLPAYRGNGVMSKLLLKTVESFAYRLGEDTLIALKCFPLQHEHENVHVSKEWARAMELQNFEQDFESATARLMTHYGALGFKSTGMSGLMLASVEDIVLAQLGDTVRISAGGNLN